ncbi:MAG: hypothetical protein KGS47_11960 [Chloroflexi bacterium]|nr:hypothetical protein [Chloroflexota bacterium]
MASGHGALLRVLPVALCAAWLASGCLLAAGPAPSREPWNGGIRITRLLVSAQGSASEVLDTGAAHRAYVVDVTAETRAGTLAVVVRGADGTELAAVGRGGRLDAAQATLASDAAGHLALVIQAWDARAAKVVISYRPIDG